MEELVEDFFGMCERYLRHAPHIVANYPQIELLLDTACEAAFMIHKVNDQ